MKQIPEDQAREYRIDYEAVVDAYDEIERALGWYYYLEGKIVFPFPAKCKLELVTSPLSVGDKVEVHGMAGEENCEDDMLVLIGYKKKKLAVPLSQLECLSSDEDTIEAVEDWHYWVGRGYQF